MDTHADRAQQPRSWLRDERGSATLSLAIVFPVVLLLIFTAVQGGLYYYARSVALAAAEEGLRDARAEGGTSAAGAQRAQTFLADAGGASVLENPAVTTSRNATNTSVTVVGNAPSVLPGVSFPVSQTASGPIERVTLP
ncbi:TadE/TadG family type IV pilus assembly protein [Modestobacter marinus]|uniref:Flp pilus assembly protein TadG n=1 Tax=Modestobacter marinus TaxID=477641 RepID=A0A846M3N7_9ACTN|nr:TadE/TadG family type IV pilus assembly protein [Modestobacter marinus]NIH70239.1 Flp pilus assembly protein TadG [Modestobacter marinus]GGL84882.1 membrane protein [Modestobacter marinus]